jgi:uncharacterized Tic20 family protein
MEEQNQQQPQPPQNEDELTLPEQSQDAKNMAMLCHLLGLVGFIGPLMIWLIEKDKHRFVYEHGKAAMNYQVSLIIYYIGSSILIPAFGLGLLLMCLLIIAHIVFIIMATLKATKGQLWQYPIAIKFIK